LTGIFSAAVVSMVSRVIDHASSGSSGRSPRTLKAFSTAILYRCGDKHILYMFALP